MYSQCCYRLVPFGTVIHDRFDWNKKTLVGYPNLIIPGSLANEQFGNVWQEHHEILEKDNYQMCEAALLADKSYMLCVDWNNVQYDCYTMSGTVECRRVPEHTPYRTYTKYALDLDRYAPVGVEVTDYSQLRFSSGTIYRIAYADGIIHTALGRFKLDKEICNRLRKWRPDYKLYKLIREPNNNMFGYLFLDTGYGLLTVDGNGNLEIQEVPYGIEI